MRRARATSTRTPSRSDATGRGSAPPQRRRSSTTCASVAREHGVDRLRRRRTPRSSAAPGTTAAAGRSTRDRRPHVGRPTRSIVATGQLHRPALPAHRGPRAVRRPQLPLGRVGPRLRPARQARRGDRDGRERRAVRARAGRGRPGSSSSSSAAANWFLPRRNRPYPAPIKALIRHVGGGQVQEALHLVGETLTLMIRHPRTLGRLGHARSAAFMRWRCAYSDPPQAVPSCDLTTLAADAAGRWPDRADHRHWPRHRRRPGRAAHHLRHGLQPRLGSCTEETRPEARAEGAHAHLGIASGFPSLFPVSAARTLGAAAGAVRRPRPAETRRRAARRQSGRICRPASPAPRGRAATPGTATSSGRIVTNWPGYMHEYVASTRVLDPGQFTFL